MHVIVIVLGDLGRSPRMQYHCLSLLEAGHHVTAIGYTGEGLIPALNEQQITDGDGPSCSARRLQVIRFNTPSLLKAFRQRQRRPGFIIDWHNLGYSMFRNGSKLQRITKIYESWMAPLADGHLTVTKAMKEYLVAHMGVTTSNIAVLYDCPPSMFAPLDACEQHKIMSKLNPELIKSCPESWISELNTSDAKKTLLTEEYLNKNGSTCIRHRPGRPALITSSTSWTPDEDFGLLLKALLTLDNKIKTNADDEKLRVLVIVTGKGPERSKYEERISQLHLEFVAIATLWLEASDYPKLLACADVGVSLHTSTSGLDLPMKVLDLFGCEVPVLAHDFTCLNELVKDRVNGRIFSRSDELANLMYTLLQPLSLQGMTPVPNHSFGDLQTYSEQLQGRTRWHTNWIDHALPVLMLATPKSK